MKIGILSKRKIMFTGKMKNYLEDQGFSVKIYTKDNLCINKSLLQNDFFILKSKQLFFLYAGYYLESNNIPVIPNTDISYRHKNRIEAHLLLKKLNILSPQFYIGTHKTLKNQLKDSDFPLIRKPFMSSGSKGIKVINAINELDSDNGELIYLEKYLEGTHYLSYFIGEEMCNSEKQPLLNEHARVKNVDMIEEIKKIVVKWKNEYNLLFGHLDIVREDKTNNYYVVDPGSFPEFTNWMCGSDPTSKICDLILKSYESLKKI